MRRRSLVDLILFSRGSPCVACLGPFFLWGKALHFTLFNFLLGSFLVT